MESRHSTFAVLALVLTLAGCTGGEEPGDADAPKETTVPGPVLTATLEARGTIVTVILANSSDGEVRVVRPTVTPNFVLFTVLDGAGEPLQYHGAYPQLRPLDESGFATLAPGESTSADFDLAELFPVTTGTYQVEAEYRNPARGSHEGASALTFEPGEGVSAAAIAIEVP